MTLVRDILPEAIKTRQETYEYKNHRSIEAWYRAANNHLLPALGEREVSSVTRADIVQMLRPMWRDKTTTAAFVRSVAAYVFSYAIYLGEYAGANPASWEDGLRFALPAPQQVHKTTHREAPTLGELCRIMPVLAASGETGARCLAFGILTGLRATEFRALRWEEVDFGSRTIYIPPSRRKDKKDEPFAVPLSRQAVGILELCKRDSELVFPGRKGDKPITTAGLLYALRKRLPAHKGVTVHGSRSTFSDWCAETGKDSTLRETCLMHATGNAVARAYQRADLLEQRRPIMQAWADAIFHA